MVLASFIFAFFKYKKHPTNIFFRAHGWLAKLGPGPFGDPKIKKSINRAGFQIAQQTLIGLMYLQEFGKAPM